MEIPDWFLDVYSMRGKDPDFATGRRSELVYALENSWAYFTALNPDGPEPFEYLDFAKKDISQGDLGGALGALANAKKAIHLTIDVFLSMLGLNHVYAKSKFPQKLEIIQLLQIFPVRAIENLNRRRNFIEHEYLKISWEEASELVDIAEMFITLAYPLLNHTTVGAYVGVEHDNQCLEWILDPLSSMISVYMIEKYDLLTAYNVNVAYNILGDSRKHIASVKITKSNRDEWLKYLDLFVYLSRKRILGHKRPDENGHGLYISRYGKEHFVKKKMLP